MILQILGIAGFFIFGYILPEMCILLGSGKHVSPGMLNIMSAAGAGLMSSYLILGA